MSGETPTRPSVCIISHAHPDFSSGGGQIAAYRQFQTMRRAGWDASFAAAADLRPAGTGAGLPPLPVVMPYAEGEHLITIDRMSEDRLHWEDADQRRALVRFLAGLQVDVYHFHHYWRIGIDLIADLAEARPDAHFVMTLHEMLAICLHHGQMIKTRGRELCHTQSALRCLGCFPSESMDALVLRKAYMLRGLQKMDHVIYCSEFLKARYLDWGLSNRGSVLENYLGDDMLALPRPTPSGANAHRFAFFGQPTAFKGLDVLLRAMALLPKGSRKSGPSPVLLVFGAEQADVVRLFPSLAPLLDELGQSVTFAGRYEPGEVIPLMRSVGWVVVPSIWWENSPVVIQEARRAGTPLIVSDIGGMAEKVTPGRDGLHFRRNSATDLAETLEHAAKPTVREQFSASVADVIDRDAFLAGLGEAYARPALRRRFAQEREAVG